MRNQADLEAIHRQSFKNRELLQQSERAGCFYCQTTFSASEVRNWVHEKDGGATALCPRCGIDAVLPETGPNTLTNALLAEMHERWF